MSYVGLYSALMFVMIHKTVVRYCKTASRYIVNCARLERVDKDAVSSYYLSKYNRKYEMLSCEAIFLRAGRANDSDFFIMRRFERILHRALSFSQIQ